MSRNSDYHAHMQIQYKKENGDIVESLMGFDPRKEKDREFAHKMLDEYLDVMGKFITKVQCENEENMKYQNTDSIEDGFHIWPFVDKH